MKATIFLLLFTFALCGTHAQTKIEVNDLTPLVKEYAFREMPALNPQTVFKVEEYQITGLWEALKMQLFLARYMLPDGEQFNEQLLIFHNGQITPFASTFGGWGLMSAVVLDNALYYTYSWGSGIHRSHIGKLTVEDEKLNILESDGYFHQDIFVSHKDGKIQVESGRFSGFNAWETISYLGTLQAKDATFILVKDEE